MALVLLYRDGFLPGDGRTEYSITEYNFDTVSNTVQVTYSDSEIYTPYSRPFSSVVDTDAVGELTRYTYHNGQGTVRFQDVAPPPPPPPPNPLVLSSQVKRVSTYGQNDGAITIFVSGGVGPYTYIWNTGANTQNLSGLVSAYYMVRATDSTGRYVEETFFVPEGTVITDKPDLVATLPANGAFSHSPIVLMAQSEEIGAQTRCIVYTYLPAVAPVGSKVIFNDVVFLAGQLPDESTFDRMQAPQSFVALFNNTPELNYKYIASAGTVLQSYGYDVVIEARLPGSRYIPTMSIVGPAQVGINIQGGTDATRGDSLKNYGVMVEVLAGFTGNYNVPTADNKGELKVVGAPLQRNYQPDNLYEFDLSAVIRRLIPVWRPNPALATIQHNPQSNFTFFCRLYEMYSTGASNYRQQVLKYETPLQKVLLGVLPQGSPNSSKPWTYFANSPALPLSVPLEKPVPYNGIELFSFVLDFANQAGLTIGNFNLLPLRLKVVISWKDGTEELRYTNAILPQQGGVYSQRIDPAVFGLLNQVPDIDSYQVQAMIGTTPITVPTTIRPYEAEYSATRLMFLSSLGVFETFTLAGQTATKVERSTTTFTRTLPFEPRVSDAYEQTREVSLRKMPTVYSHALSREVFDWLLDLLKSPQIYQIDAAGQLNPVLIADFNYECDSLTQLYNVAVTLKPHRTEAALSL